MERSENKEDFVSIRGVTEGPYFDKVVKCQNPKTDSVKLMFGLHKNAFIFVLALFKND